MAGRKRKYPIALTTAERNRIKEALRSTKSSNTIKQRCRILLALDCNQNPNTTYDDIIYHTRLNCTEAEISLSWAPFCNRVSPLRNQPLANSVSPDSEKMKCVLS
ncbi:hypothetical protein SAMN05216582_10132 [Selenomonas ruminantium]|uniref:Uncharacterized protein n=1 Tax=Selenomonas ruminantium TaxID=971 RepID=A0A1M6QXK3_SELRU|nr:hypothetical protein SAMN05216582_10132 [Selenomonas ruminantium]